MLLSDETRRGIDQMGATAAAMALATVRRRPRLRILDLGCGRGELTRQLARLLPESEVVGVDRAPDLVAEARRGGGDGVGFVEADISSLPRDGSWDLVFSSSTLQWLPDHEALVPSLPALSRRSSFTLPPRPPAARPMTARTTSTTACLALSVGV